MAIDITKMDFHIAGRDAQGHPILVAKPVPTDFAAASPTSRLTYWRAAQREEQEVIAAARAANAPPKPANWEKFSATERRTWHLMAERGGSR